MDIRKSMEKKRTAGAIETLTKGGDQKGLQFPAGITLNSICYMDLIREIEEPTISKLAEILHVSKSAVTMKMADLEKQGYVRKIVSDKDKRIKYLALTEKILDVYEKFDLVDEAIYQALEEKFPKVSLEHFCEILDFISDGIIDNVRK